MKYFAFLNDIIDNFRVSKMIEIVKIEQDLETNELITVAYEATRSLIIVANYKDRPDIDMPQVQGFSQLDFIKQIISLEAQGEKSSVKFKDSDGYAVETNFKIDNTNIKNKNVAKSLLPETPRKLSGFAPDLEVELDEKNYCRCFKKIKFINFQCKCIYNKIKQRKFITQINK